MEIQINSCPVNFELENEKKVAQVIDSISAWALERDLIFIEARVDNKSYNIGSVPDITLENVNVLNCVVQSRGDVVISTLEEGMAYCDRITGYIENVLSNSVHSGKDIDAMAGGIDWLIDTISSVSRLLGVNLDEISHKDANAQRYIENLIDFKSKIVKAGSGDGLTQLLKNGVSTFKSIKEIFKIMLLSGPLRQLVIKSIDSPDQLLITLNDIKKNLRKQLENLEQTAIAYQTGKDNIGSEKLQTFVDFLYNYSRTCHQAAAVFQIDLSGIIIEGVKLDAKNNRILELLGEILSTLENNDIISLSDILEYEMKPELENLELYIDALLKSMKV